MRLVTNSVGEQQHPGPRLLLAEHDYQVEDMISQGLDRDGDWVALGPSAMAYLEGRGIDFRIPESFHDWDELQSACEETHRVVKDLCEQLDERLVAEDSELRRYGIRPFRFSIFPLTILFDSVRSRVFQLKRILDTHPDHLPTIHAGRPHPPGRWGLAVSNRENLWGRVAALDGFGRPIALLPEVGFSGGRDASVWLGLARWARARLEGRVTLHTIVRSLRSRDHAGLWSAVQLKRSSVLLIDPPGEWSRVLPRLRPQGLRPLWVTQSYFAAPGAPLAEGGVEPSISALGESHLILERVAYAPLVEQRLSALWRQAGHEFRVARKRFQRLAHRTRATAVLRGSSNWLTAHSVNQVAAAMDIPVVTWQHGMVTDNHGISQLRDYCDVMTTDLLLAYGSGSADGYARFGSDRATVVPVGSPVLDALRVGRRRHRSRSDPRRILYATTNYYQNDWYLGFQPGISDRLLYTDQLVILRNLVQISKAHDVEVTAKLHPHPEYQEPPWALNAQRKGLGVVRGERSFVELLNWADLVVLDLPSTTLLQTLAAACPTFVLMRYWRLGKDAEDLLRGSAVHAATVDQLMFSLRRYLENGTYPGDPTDTAWLREWGTQLDDGASVERATAALGSMLSRERPKSDLAATVT